MKKLFLGVAALALGAFLAVEADAHILVRQHTDIQHYSNAINELETFIEGVNNNSSASYTFALTDEGTYMVGNASTGTWTIPQQSVVAFPVGSTIWIENDAATTLTVAAGTGVTLHGTCTLSVQYSRKIIKMTAANVWSCI